MTRVSILPRLAIMMAGLLFAFAQEDDVSVSSDDSIPLLPFCICINQDLAFLLL
jgi:hypothetical protein